MENEFFERLSAMDAMFLELEDDTQHMHVGAVLILDGRPLPTEDGGVDIERIREYVAGAIRTVPRCTQRLAYVPMLKHPVWVDDPQFNIHFHVRHTALPRPGDERQLKRLAARIFSQRLDRTRPLWEIWIVEGLEGDRAALISKVHHAVIDGLAGVELMAALLSMSDDASFKARPPFAPRSMPSKLTLLAAEVAQRAEGSSKLWQNLMGLLDEPRRWFESAREMGAGLSGTVMTGLTPASHTSLESRSISSYRRFDVCKMPLRQAKSVKKALGGTVNDVILATVTGAVRRFLARRGEEPDAASDFRACIPVGLTRKRGDGSLGNHVSLMFARLPVHLADPRDRYAAVVAETQRQKETSSAEQAGHVIAEAGDHTGAGLIVNTARLGARLHPFNVVVTNVPGPPVPLYFLGARLDDAYPLVPLFGKLTTGIAIFSYDDALHWGLHVDWQLVPDVHMLAEDLRAAFEELGGLAGGAPS
jgi:diacylglycerol O-acyltransferase